MKRLGDEARSLLAGAGVADAGELAAVVEAWPAAVGDTIARAAWPRRIARDGTLHVATVSSTWAFELGRLEHEVAGRLHAALGERAPRALRFAPGHVPEPAGDAAEATPTPLEISAESRSEAGRLAAGIESDELREVVARAAAASLERGRADRHFC